MRSVKEFLSNVPLYVGLQKIVGSDLLRYECIDAAQIHPGDTVVDVGCGPAYYYDRFPDDLNYHGFDTDAGYIAWAEERYGGRGSFHLGIFDAEAAAGVPPPDVILMLGLLHHLDDQAATALLELAAVVLAPGGRVVSADPTFTPDQGRLSRWMSENDRGGHVRNPDVLEGMARLHFEKIETEIVSHGRILGTHLMMTMHKTGGSLEGQRAADPE